MAVEELKPNLILAHKKHHYFKKYKMCLTKVTLISKRGKKNKRIAETVLFRNKLIRLNY